MIKDLTYALMERDYPDVWHMPLLYDLHKEDVFRTAMWLGGTVGWGTDPNWENEFLPPSREGPVVSGSTVAIHVRQTSEVIKLPFIGFMFLCEFHFAFIFYQVEHIGKTDLWTGLVYVEESWGRNDVSIQRAMQEHGVKSKKSNRQFRDSFDEEFTSIHNLLGGTWMSFYKRPLSYLVHQLLKIPIADAFVAAGIGRTLSVPAKDKIMVLCRTMSGNNPIGKNVSVTYREVKDCVFRGDTPLFDEATGQFD